MVTVKQLHESLNRLYEDYEDIRPNVKIKVGKRFLNEDIKVKRGENDWDLTLEQVQAIVNRAINDSAIPEEAIDEIIWWPNADSYTGDIEIKFNDGYEKYIEDFDEYDIFNVFANWVDDNYDEDDDLDESLTEANHENDEVNDVIRRNRKTRIKNISDSDKQILNDNGIKIKGNKNQYPEFHGKNRAFKLGYDDYNKYNFNKKNRYYGDRLHPAPALKSKDATYPDFDNPDYDIKGWLDTERSRDQKYPDLFKPKGLRPYSDEWKQDMASINRLENQAREYRKDSEATISNDLLEFPDGNIPPENHNTLWRLNDRRNTETADYFYKIGRKHRDKWKKDVEDIKHKHGVYESLNESVVTTNPAKYSEFIDAIGDIQNWVEDYEIDLQDVLYDVFNHSPESKFEDFIINLRNEYKDEE